MINPVSIKCPECSAFLEIEEGRKQVYCTYCGAKLIMCNDNEYIVRHIDEAKVNRVEAEKLIELKKLEIEEKEKNEKRKIHKFVLIFALVLFVIGVLLCFIKNGDMYGLLFIVLAIDIALFSSVKPNSKT